MREVIVELNGERKVVIKELRIKDILKVIVNIKEVFGDEDLDLQKLVEDKFDIIASIASDFIIMPDSTSLDELTFSDIDALTAPFKEVNQSFLDKLTSMGLSLSNLMPQPEVEDLVPQKSDGE